MFPESSPFYVDRPGESVVVAPEPDDVKVAAPGVTISQGELENLYRTLDDALHRATAKGDEELEDLIEEARNVVYAHLR